MGRTDFQEEQLQPRRNPKSPGSELRNVSQACEEPIFVCKLATMETTKAAAQFEKETTGKCVGGSACRTRQ